MNRVIAKTGAAIVTASCSLFAVFLVIDFAFGSYFICMFLPIGYIMTAAGFQHECSENSRVAANIGLILSAVYAVLIFLVYYAQTTTVNLETLTEQAKRIIDYKYGSLLFNYDLLGYGIMALSTFFVGLSIKAENKPDKWLRALLMIHGVFFLSCFFMPMTGMFTNIAEGGGKGGSIALIGWCVYFIPIGVLSFIHFGKKN